MCQTDDIRKIDGIVPCGNRTGKTAARCIDWHLIPPLIDFGSAVFVNRQQSALIITQTTDTIPFHSHKSRLR